MHLQLHRISCDACNFSDHILKLIATSIFVFVFHAEELMRSLKKDFARTTTFFAIVRLHDDQRPLRSV
jgi:hypothetical protein